MKKLILISVILFSINSCKNSTNNNSNENSDENTEIVSENEADDEDGTGSNNSENENTEEESSEESDEIEDGTYSADVDYYNSNTGTSSSYTLDVKVRDGKLIEIEWENRGWLDESHFTAPDITDGTATFTDDEDREYTVRLRDF